MGNTPSSKTNSISALTSIRDDAMERLTTVSLELIQVEIKLINRDLLSSEEIKVLLKKKIELQRNKKLIQSNVDMSSNGLLMIQQKEFNEIKCKENEITRILTQSFNY